MVFRSSGLFQRPVKLFFATCLLALSGCTTNYYTLGDEKFDDEEDFIKATIEKTAAVNRSIMPLSKPLTSRQLVIVFPSKEALFSQSKANVKANTGKDPDKKFAERIDTMAQHSAIAVKAMYEAAKIKGIYLYVSYRESETTTNTLAPSADYDTLVWYEERPGAGQWFYSNLKFGKQVFTWDRTSANMQISTESFLASLQALAIRE